MSLRLAFMGTGDFAVPALRALHGAGHTLALVICQPDRPKGRGHQLQAPPLKQAALALGLEVFQPEKLRAPEALQRLLDAKADLGCVVSYGQILSQAALDAPRLGCVNVHGSLLPRWRGAAPIEWALAEGDSVTGVCVQRMVLKLDAGDVLKRVECPVTDETTAPALHASLALLGAEALLATLGDLENGRAVAQAQNESAATYAPLLKKEDGYLDPAWPARKFFNRARAFQGRPGAQLQVEGGERLKLRGVRPAEGGGEAGRLLAIDEAKGFQVACGEASVWIQELQGPGSKAMPAAAYGRGHRLDIGTRFLKPADLPEA